MNSPLILKIFNVICETGYDSLVDLLWEEAREGDIERLFEAFKNEHFKYVWPSRVSDKEYQSKLYIYNAALYIYKAAQAEYSKIEDIDSQIDFLNSQIEKFKQNWLEFVLKARISKNTKKFILKELEDRREKEKGDLEEDKFIKVRTEQIQAWRKDDTKLLSDFEYISDLQKQQKNVILRLEPLLFFLREVIINSKADCSEFEKEKNGLITSKVMPDITFFDNIFGNEDIDLNDKENVTENEKHYLFRQEANSNSLSIKILKDVIKEGAESSNSFSIGSNEFKITCGIFAIGEEQLLNSNIISFNADELCEKIGMEKNTKTYDFINNGLSNLRRTTYEMFLDGIGIREFGIISAFTKPFRDSQNKLTWRVEIDQLLRDRMLMNKVFSYDIGLVFLAKTKLTPILYRLLVLDSYQNIASKVYSLEEITLRTRLKNEKPSKRKDKVENALKEIQSKKPSIIKKFEVDLKYNFHIEFDLSNKLELDQPAISVQKLHS